MALKSQAGTRAMLDAINALADGGTMTFYTGGVPSTVDTGATGTLLGTLTMAATAFSPATGTTTASADLAGTPIQVSAVADGTPTYARLTTSGAAAIQQYTVGGGGEITFDDYTWVSGGTINLTSLSTTLPVA